MPITTLTLWVREFDYVRSLLSACSACFAGRYVEEMWDGRQPGDGYLRTACDYMHLNPVRAGLLDAGERLLAYPRSTLGWYLCIEEQLSRLEWNQSDLALRRKSDPAKLAIGARLRKETTLSIKGIAARLHLGTSKSASARLHQWMGQTERSDSPKGQLLE